MKLLTMILSSFALLGCSSALKDPICEQEPAANGIGGISCKAYIPRWTYYANTDECCEFIFGGCDGNDNHFETEAECEAKCKC